MYAVETKMRYFKKWGSGFIIPLLLIPHLILSQHALRSDTIAPASIYSIGLATHYGFVFVHSKEVKNTQGSKPWGIELDFNKQLLKNESWDECHCFPRTGIVLSYFNLDNNDLGHSFNAAIYIEPFINPSHRVKVSMKGAAGLSWLTNPYHETTNPENKSYSMALNAYLGLGLGVNFKISRKIHAKFSAYYNHISNGGLKDPNYGINWPTLTVQAFYLINPAPLPLREKDKNVNYKNKPLRKDIILYLTQKNDYAIWGGGFAVSKQISGMNALTLGTEVTSDHALEKRMEEDEVEDKNYVYAGLLAGHEFLMGRFNFSQQIGVYIYKDNDYYNALYQRYGLMYSISKLLSFGVNLKAHGKEANFLDGRIVLSLRGKKKL